MEEEAKAAQETAKAAQEMAKVAGKGLELVEQAGPFIERVLGPPVEDAVGILADRLRYYRFKQFYRLRDKTQKLLAERGIEKPKSVLPKFALPLLEAATIEDDEDLHDLWARLLANAMDPTFEHDVNRSFITILQDFTPLEAALLKRLYRFTVAQPKEPAFDIRTKHFREAARLYHTCACT